MIRNFKHRGLKRFFVDGDKKLLDHHLTRRIDLLLSALDVAKAVSDMNFPGAYLHELKGNRKGFWSVRVSGNWRITFRFEDEDAYEVNLEDYH
jgi:proteic killer suppression protein